MFVYNQEMAQHLWCATINDDGTPIECFYVGAKYVKNNKLSIKIESIQCLFNLKKDYVNGIDRN